MQNVDIITCIVYVWLLRNETYGWFIECTVQLCFPFQPYWHLSLECKIHEGSVFFGGYRTTVSVTFIVLSRSPIFILIIYNLHYFSSVCTSYGCPQLVLVLRMLFAQDLDSDSSKDQCHNKSELCSKRKQYLWNELIMTNIYDFNYITELSSNKK